MIQVRGLSILVAVVSLLLETCQGSWVDPDTPIEAHRTIPLTEGDNRKYALVFSDEFEKDGRTFHDGTDPRWTAINKNDYTNSALHYYSHDNAVTTNGVLNITTERKVNTYKAFDEKKLVYYADKKYVQSAMLQSWNKFCFIGGVVEFSAKLPGHPRTGGLWPALWMLGNLARATYVGSTNYIWPFSYNKCTEKTRLSQEINACSKVNHFGLESYRGRGSPEIDIIEAMQGDPGKLPNTFIQRPYQSASFQISPGLEMNRPLLGHRPNNDHWYHPLEYGNETLVDLNPFFYGVTLVHKPKTYTYQSDALSANLQLNDTHYKRQHIYRVEWEPPEEDGTGGYIKWFTDGKLVYGIFGESLQITETEIPSEPMYLLMNTAVSSHWGFPTPCPENCDCDCFECGNPSCMCGLPEGYCDNFPAFFEIDYVRVYQALNESKHVLGCSPEHRPTSLFIEGHAQRYMTDGQKRPLIPVRKGGGVCAEDTDCGGPDYGSCVDGVCICNSSYTGPNCLSPDGYYDFDTSTPTHPLSLRSIVIPKSLTILICILAMGFLTSMLCTVRVKSRETKYERLNNTTTQDTSFHSISNGIPYQNPASADYALPPQQKVVTYCVIDGRLVDQQLQSSR